MNLFLIIVLFIAIAAGSGFLMATLERKNLKKWSWALFGFIIILSFILTSKNNLAEGLILTAINAVIIYVFYEIFLNILPKFYK